MPRIYIEFAGMKQMEESCKSMSSTLNNIRNDFQQTINHLDWDIKYQSNINSIATQITRKLDSYVLALRKYEKFLGEAYNEYNKLNNEKFNPFAYPINFTNVETLPGTNWKQIWLKYISSLFKNITITRPYAFPAIISMVIPAISPFIKDSGLLVNSSNSANTSAGWFGYKFDDDHPNVSAWIGKASAETKNESSYAEVNAYLGKVDADAKADISLVKSKQKKEYNNNSWSEKEQLSYLNAEASIGSTATALAADAKAGVGNDMLGLEGKMEGKAGSARAGAKGQVSIGKDGVNAYVKGEAMVAAVEGKASGTINILGIEITGEVGGYAGAAGVEGKFGIEDGKYVVKGGAAAILGGSVGIEVGVNDEGWDNFVDFITFWD